ncbi:hypothetical protein AHAS_Ahas19G0100100 [Arachis hypogaea]
MRRYNGRHTCIMGIISQDHFKLNSDTVVEGIRPLVKTDPSIKVKSIIAKVQSRFNYTIGYRKKMPDSIVQIETRPLYNGSEETDDVRIIHRIFWSFNPCIWSFNPCIWRFKYCKPLVQVDGTHLYGKYKGALLVAVAQDGN